MLTDWTKWHPQEANMENLHELRCSPGILSWHCSYQVCDLRYLRLPLTLYFQKHRRQGKNQLKTLAEADDEANEGHHIINPFLYWLKKNVSVRQLTQDANLLQLKEEDYRAIGIVLPYVDFS